MRNAAPAHADPPGVESFPPWKQFEMQPKDEVQFRLKGQGRNWKWTVNGKPSGDGDEFVLKPDATGKMIVRGTGVDPQGRTVDRAWEIDVRGGAPTPATVSPPAAPRRPKPTRTVRTPPPAAAAPSETARPATELPLDLDALAPKPPPAPAPSHAADTSGAADVRGLLDRYATAYRERDVDALRRLGQVTSDGQAEQMRDYFDKTPELDVEVKILDVSRDGGKTKVRFTRRDRFKDPTGNEVSKETPPIEKEVVETPDGLKLQAPGE